MTTTDIVDLLNFIPVGFHNDGSGSVAHIFVGRTDEADRVYLDIELRNSRVGEWQTTEHETVNQFVELSITGMVVGYGRSHPESVGQIVAALEVVDYPEGSLNREHISELVALWDQWHLNGLTADCAHQTVVWEGGPYGNRPSLELTEPCPHTGYRYGSAWLVKPLPRSVIDQLSAIVQLATPSPSRYTCNLYHA